MSEEECPLVIPPAQNVMARISVIMGRGARGKADAVFQRRPVRKLLANLNDTLQDCAVQVGLAPRLWDSPGRWRQMAWDMGGGLLRAELEDDALAAHIRAKNRYKSWHAYMYRCMPVGLSVCVRVCQLEDSIDRIRLDERISERTAIKMLQAGLNEYAIIWGRGDQIGP